MLTSRAHTQDTGPWRDDHRHHGHAHFWERALSRGQFIRTAAGATGLALSSGLWMPALARADAGSSVLARPIPGGGQFLGPGTELFHAFDPAPANEVSSITDFKGLIGAAHVQGPATRTLSNGATTTLYADYDLRFMKGLYIGVDGQRHHGTFSFFWFDLFEKLDASGGVDMSSQQFTSIDPGNVPDGLFWTVLVPDDSVQVDLDDGTAVMQVSNFATEDFQNNHNDLTHGASIPTTVSFIVRWSGLQDREIVRLPLLSDGSPGFIAHLAQSTTSGVTVAWSADEPTAVVNGVTGAHYGADAGAAVRVLYAGLGRERNGVFFSQEHRGGDHQEGD